MKENIITLPDGRQVCQKFKQCGGCAYEISYAEQLARKQAAAEGLLGRFGKVSEIVSGESERYRCKVTRVYKKASNGRLICGVYKSSGNTLVPVKDCILEDKRLCEIARGLCGVFESFRLTPFDPVSGRGTLRHVLLRKGRKTGEIMLCIVTNSPVIKSPRSFANAIAGKFPDITTIVHNICTDSLPISLGSREEILLGKGYIEDELLGLRFKIGARSFMQVNPAQAERLYGLARGLLFEGTGTLLDAYCGTGTIGLICAEKAERLIGIESNSTAVSNARQNAAHNGIKNAEFICADAGKVMEQIAQEGGEIGALIMDPPRAGADRRFLDSAAKLAPEQIIYISCNMKTLARDLSILKKTGYKAQSITPVDMFPRTRHCECIVSLIR